jgi:3'-phosphoadenosine 5'-phosphosulfate (PAPS) 3'-phosphatase
MHLSKDDLFLLANCAISAAYQAGIVISKNSNRELAVETKIGGESLASQVITEVDLLSQEIILNTLLPTCKLYDLALLTEEKIDDQTRLEKDFFWCIDPLDGTLPFIDSTSGYAVSIALVSHAGIAQIGVIYDPIKQNLYHAIKGQGAFYNGKTWRLNSPSSVTMEKKPLTVINDRSFIQQSYYTQVITQLETIAIDLGFNGLKLIQHGGAVMNACWVLENSPGCYFKFPKKNNGGGSIWDYAATSCLFNETTAINSDIYGRPLAFNQNGTTFMNRQGVIYATNQLLANQISLLFKMIN